MAKPIIFSHRPPSSGIHLLSDPIPPRPAPPANVRTDKKIIQFTEQPTRSKKYRG